VPDEIRLNKEKADKFINFRLNVRDPYQKAYQLGVTYNLARNKLIVSSALSYKKQGLNCMTLVRIERHGQILVEMMREQGIRCDFINGKSSHDVQEEAKKSGSR
jgi:superfamily II DNA or RNA helicase